MLTMATDWHGDASPRCDDCDGRQAWPTTSSNAHRPLPLLTGSYNMSRREISSVARHLLFCRFEVRNIFHSFYIPVLHLLVAELSSRTYLIREAGTVAAQHASMYVHLRCSFSVCYHFVYLLTVEFLVALVPSLVAIRDLAFALFNS